jgi:hypothetical protein
VEAAWSACLPAVLPNRLPHLDSPPSPPQPTPGPSPFPPTSARLCSRLEEALPDVFESLQEAYRGAEGRMAQELLRRYVLKLLRIWRGWFVFSDDFINGLQVGQGGASGWLPAWLLGDGSGRGTEGARCCKHCWGLSFYFSFTGRHDVLLSPACRPPSCAAAAAPLRRPTPSWSLSWRC